LEAQVPHRGLALELSPIRVNPISSRYVDTPLRSRLDEAAQKVTFERIATSLPTKTIGQLADDANTVHFLTRSPFSAGSTVRGDGGGVIS
jgi:NAD(P)-dependent dehydrogenase (short-subunit alcohol dehydrogenase family)